MLKLDITTVSCSYAHSLTCFLVAANGIPVHFLLLWPSKNFDGNIVPSILLTNLEADTQVSFGAQFLHQDTCRLVAHNQDIVHTRMFLLDLSNYDDNLLIQCGTVAPRVKRWHILNHLW